jgi:hypothetical protein
MHPAVSLMPPYSTMKLSSRHGHSRLSPMLIVSGSGATLRGPRPPHVASHFAKVSEA